jgi:hypothetical protein
MELVENGDVASVTPRRDPVALGLHTSPDSSYEGSRSHAADRMSHRALV